MIDWHGIQIKLNPKATTTVKQIHLILKSQTQLKTLFVQYYCKHHKITKGYNCGTYQSLTSFSLYSAKFRKQMDAYLADRLVLLQGVLPERFGNI